MIDWKTGAEPSAANEKAVVMQLAAYRLAWAELMDVPIERVRAAFHYVRTGRTIAPDHLPDADALARLLRSAGSPEEEFRPDAEPSATR